MKKAKFWPVILSALLLGALISSAAMAAAEPTGPVETITPGVSLEPASEPASEPEFEPLLEPVIEPTPEQSVNPSAEPALEPSTEPTIEPTAEPTVEPTIEPTVEPSVEPTPEPTTEPENSELLPPLILSVHSSAYTLLSEALTYIKITYKIANASGNAYNIVPIEYSYYLHGQAGIQLPGNPYQFLVTGIVFNHGNYNYSIANCVPDAVLANGGQLYKIKDGGDGQTGFNIKEGQINEIEFHYTIKSTISTLGSLTITKDITGDTPLSTEDFEFSITGPNGYTGSVTLTGEDSETIDNLEPGYYTVEEINVPANYAAGTNPQVGTVPSGGNAGVTFINTYTLPRGSLQITKLYAGAAAPDGQVFNFTIYDSGMNSVATATITSGGSSTAIVNNLVPGNYTVVETGVPFYTADSTSKPFTITSGGTAYVSFTNIYAPLGSIKIIKSLAGAAAPAGSQFTFIIRDSSGNPVGSDIVITGSGNQIISNLPADDYTVEEKAPLPAYFSVDLTGRQDVAVTAGGMAEITFTNTYAPTGSLTITKVTGSHSADPIPGTPMADVEFGLFAGASSTTPLYPTVKTDANGVAAFAGIPAGNYVLKEISQPNTQYELAFIHSGTAYPDGMPVSVNTGVTTSYTVSNEPAKVTIRAFKYDKRTRSPLKGAEIALYLQGGATVMSGIYSGTYITSGFTDLNGMVEFTSLWPGTYILYETAPPAGYLNDSTPVTVPLLTGGTNNFGNAAVFSNNQPATAIVRKIASDNSARLPGATFALYKDSVAAANLTGRGTTDANGNITFSGLAPGNYIFVEESAPSGFYAAANTSIALDSGDIITITISDTRIPVVTPTPTRPVVTPTPRPRTTPTPTPVPTEPVVTIAITEPPYGPSTGENTGLLITAGIFLMIGVTLLIIRRRLVYRNN